MAIVHVSATNQHSLTFDRTRGRGVVGGWRWVPLCSCGWNVRARDFFWRSPRGSMFSDSYPTAQAARDAHTDHHYEMAHWPDNGRILAVLQPAL